MKSLHPTANAWMYQVQPGDQLNPDPFWNKTERWAWQLAAPCPILAVHSTVGASQSGLMFEVRAKGGDVLQLDADWFEAPSPVQPCLFS